MTSLQNRPSADPVFHTKKIIGENDLRPVLENGANVPEKFRPFVNAFGKMSMGCTATHIGGGIVLSAGHCFRAPKSRSTLECPDVTVDWGFRKDAPAYLTSRCIQVLSARANYEEDYAIFKVEPAPDAHIGIDVEHRPTVNTPMTQFSHPRARPLEWSQVCTLQTSAQGGWGSHQFSHACDSEPGSSGSVLIDVDTLKIIGIHNGGMDQWNYATYLIDTPVREYVGAIDTNPTPAPTPSEPITLPDQTFGPFPNSSSLTLSEFGLKLGRTMSFDLLIDLEENRDFILIEYGTDQAIELTGFQKRYFRNLTLPLKITYRSKSHIARIVGIAQHQHFSKT
jgi:V8-like Glu-specific endopeptidase